MMTLEAEPLHGGRVPHSLGIQRVGLPKQVPSETNSGKTSPT